VCSLGPLCLQGTPGNSGLQSGMSSTLSSLLRALGALRAKPSFFFLCALCALRANPSFFLSLCPPGSPGNAGLQSGMSSTFSSFSVPSVFSVRTLLFFFFRALCVLRAKPSFFLLRALCVLCANPSFFFLHTLCAPVFSVRTLLFSFSVSSMRNPLFSSSVRNFTNRDALHVILSHRGTKKYKCEGK